MAPSRRNVLASPFAESNWRWEIANQGLSNLGIGLTARILSLGPTWLTNVKSGGGTVLRYILNSSPDLPLISSILPTAVLDPTANFPYGYVVNPDH